jgi:hypothetical protein
MIDTSVTPDPMAVETSKWPNPMWDLVKVIPHDPLEDWRGTRQFTPVSHGYLLVWERSVNGGPRDVRETIELPPEQRRHHVVRSYSWAIANPRALDWMTRKLRGRGLLEVGAGRGYWAWQLAMRGVDVLATDLELVGGGNNCYFSRFTDPRVAPPIFHSIVEGAGPAMAARHSRRALFLCWPPYGAEMATETLEAYRGNMLFYAGEGEGGCNAPDSFFRLLDRDWEYRGSGPMIQWSGIRDCLDLYRRKRGTR